MATELSIINRALAALGEERQLTELRGDSPPRAERVALALLPDLRDAMLRDHPWLCASARVTVTRQPLPDPVDWKFANVFLLPPDTLRLWSVDTDQAFEVGPYTLRNAEGVVTSRRKGLFTNATGPLNLSIVERVDYEHLDASLTRAMSLELASLMTGPMQADKQLAAKLKNDAREAMAYAVTVETSEFREEPSYQPGRFLTAR